MLSRMRKTYDAAFKAKVAFKAAKGKKTIAQIASEFSVHPNQIRQWRNHLMEQLPALISSRRPLFLSILSLPAGAALTVGTPRFTIRERGCTAMVKKDGFHFAFLVVSLALLSWAQPGGETIGERAKACQAEIEVMIGQGPQKVLDKLLSWKFELMAAWKTEDPASPDFKKLNKGKARFTKKEIAELLVPGGTYKIAFYGILVGTEAGTTGTIDELGRGVDKDASYVVRIYTVIRIVFRDDKLIHVRTWPKVDSAEIKGGTWRMR